MILEEAFGCCCDFVSLSSFAVQSLVGQTKGVGVGATRLNTNRPPTWVRGSQTCGNSVGNKLNRPNTRHAAVQCENPYDDAVYTFEPSGSLSRVLPVALPLRNRSIFLPDR